MMQKWIRRLGIAALVVGCFHPSAIATPVPEQQAKSVEKQEFLTFLGKLDAAQLELQKGDPAAFKALWSQADDITLSGGFGGTVEKGWKAIDERLTWVAAQFSNGKNEIERVVTNVSCDLGYVVQLEHIRFQVPGETVESRRDYRVTMIFRKESGAWRLVHRQADSQMVKAPPK